MYRLILADDEVDVREGVLHEIDWQQCGFEVVDRAENGREALEMAERWQPDVLVTDIRMPFMDGLELAEHVRRMLPGTKIIILTGYDEFEYARKSIQLGIEEFVIKPFSSQELLQALNKVKEELDREAALREDMDSLKEHYRRSLPLLRELFLGSLMTRALPEREINDKLAGYDLPLQNCRHLVAVIQLDLPADAEDIGLRSFAVRNIAEEIAQRHSCGYVIQHAGFVVLLASADRSDLPSKLENRAMAVLEEVRQSVERYLKFTVTIGIGTTIDSLRAAHYAYADAVAALDYRMVLGHNRLIPIRDVEAREASPIRYDELQEQALIRCLKVGTAQELTEIVDKQFAELVNSEGGTSVQGVQLFLLQIVTTLMKAAQDTSKDLHELFGGNTNLLSQLAALHHLSEAKQWVMDICAKMMSRIAADRQTTYRSLVDEAKAYTRAHYADSELSISQVCEHLHISAGYFSSIFKRDTKLTYVGYLLQIRMEEAKELLAATDLKAFEIAQRVGYADPNYFSFSFKKYVGLSPKDYRSRARGELP
ncbi:response regulator [Cohnella lubricantis]|uniref:Response regulator n=1 Tax=Cohnella lubricantis TaxID=2163172 RepID=A0A841TI21_9BACL|nr:response regulator [Cohnella lubricantis]MBB6679795.1 response regulator [Cohnella lubricantis]MBP2120258.1 two-component system response regulator YesN [Cohnella lubricantis]